MKRPRLIFSFLAASAAAAFAADTADTIYQNGSILTMAGKEPTYVEALAVKDGKILATGAKDEVLKTQGDTTKVVDLKGKALLPGFATARSVRAPRPPGR